MALTPYQKAFVGFDLVTKDQVVDPTTGDPVEDLKRVIETVP
jgi:hypothetical protein